MKSQYFDVKFSKETGAITKITPVGDPYKINFIKEGGSFLEPHSYILTNFSEEEDQVSADYEKNDVRINCRYHFEGERIVCEMVLKNTNSFPVYFDGREGLVLSAHINDKYDSSEVCMTNRVHAHIFTGLHSTYINAERMGDFGKNLGIVFTKGSFSSYSQKGVKSNDRGYFFLHVTPFVLKGGEIYEIACEIFTHSGKEEFAEKSGNYTSCLRVVSPEGFSFVQGETVSFEVKCKEHIASASVELDGETLAYEIDGKNLKVHFKAENPGEKKVYFTVNSIQSFAVFYVSLEPMEVVRRRIGFIVEKQQCMDETSPLFGAYLCYDNRTCRQFFDSYWPDQNASRERIGMGILIAKYLQIEKDEAVYESLMHYIDFLLREMVDEETGFVSNGIGMDASFKRLYNIPWVSVLFAEMYHLTGQERYVDIVIKTMRYFYREGGKRFYPNAVQFYELLEVVRQCQKEQEYAELSALFREHADHIVKNGVIYPSHEVNFEQTIVAPAVSILLDCYKLCGDEMYLQEAEKHLKILRRFDSDAPDVRLNKIPIRFWDDFWFGKQQCFGDTMPHYWSVLSGYCNYLYGVVTGEEESISYGLECIQNNLILFNEKGEGSCAYVYPYEVNGMKGAFFDELANDQDFALYYLLKVQEKDIAFQKPVHAQTGKDTAGNLTDGRKETAWIGEYYPSYIDIDLEKNYYLDRVEVDIPEKGLEYTLYTSMNGRDFEMVSSETLHRKTCFLHGKETRIIRVYVEYDSISSNPVLNQVRVFGVESRTPVQKRPDIIVPDFEDSKYHVDITDEDTYDEVFGIIERRIGAAYKDWFSLELSDNPIAGHAYDFFELSNGNGKIHVRGNNGVALAAGIHHYLKSICHVHLSQVGDQTVMPENVIALEKPIRKETKAKVRYAYNYCTFSYSMAFWGRKEWRRELDWLALNGVNVVLDLTAQEEVWRRFLGEIGYSHEDIKDFITGPAYYAWLYMANMSGFLGPVHDSWFEERTELARENQLIMRKLGMQPVLQGYSGMVPNDILDYDADVEIIEQGTWNSFKRPAMLKTTSACFEAYAEMFYRIQRDVYGNASHFYATDPFHEGGNTGGMSAREISRRVLSAMLKADEKAVWVIQSWQGNPTSELLAGVKEVESGADHALILDLYAEKTPHYNEGAGESVSYGYEPEFAYTPWVFCMLNNFGGRLGLHGHLDNLASYLPNAWNRCRKLVGIGITPEASENNPVLYDFFFEAIWQENADKPMQTIDLDKWLSAYITRRYGAESKAAKDAWYILKDTVYKAEWNNIGQGAPECLVCARPALRIQAASAWGNTIVGYGKKELEKAETLLLEDYELLKDSAGYQYDVVSVRQQVLSNKAGEYHEKMVLALREKREEDFKFYAKEFLAVMDEMESLTGTNAFYCLNRWVEQAQALAVHTDDFTERLYEWNARALVTTWGSYQQSETGRLHDYSNRQWSGLIGDFYKRRWEVWISDEIMELQGKNCKENRDWFAWEWNWVRN